MILIKKAQKEDLEKILELQYLAYQSEAKLFGNMDIPPLKQTIEELYNEFQKGTILKALDDIGVIIGSVISFALAYLLQTLVFSVDYSRTENTQFEDDEYYYYVKAVPKINVTAPEMNVKRINAQRRKKSAPVRREN